VAPPPAAAASPATTARPAQKRHLSAGLQDRLYSKASEAAALLPTPRPGTQPLHWLHNHAAAQSKAERKPRGSYLLPKRVLRCHADQRPLPFLHLHHSQLQPLARRLACGPRAGEARAMSSAGCVARPLEACCTAGPLPRAAGRVPSRPWPQEWLGHLPSCPHMIAHASSGRAHRLHRLYRLHRMHRCPTGSPSSVVKVSGASALFSSNTVPSGRRAV
jgi:hypothetical protein